MLTEDLLAKVVDLFLTLKLNGLLPAIDFQKAFDHSFLTFTLEKCGFGNKFVKCVKILSKN